MAARPGSNALKSTIGAMTTLTEVAKHPLVRERLSLLTEAAGLVASPQIRNQGTISGSAPHH